MKKIFCQIQKCLACRSCELACAVEHSQSKNLIDAVNETAKPVHRIHVKAVHETTSPGHRINVKPIDGMGSINITSSIALQCRHCDDPPCIEACKPGCIYKDQKSGYVAIDTEECAACWACIKVCPFGAIARDEYLNAAVKCDLCPHREIPACVEACPTGALLFGGEDGLEKIYEELLAK